MHSVSSTFALGSRNVTGKYKFEDPLSWKEMMFRMANRGGRYIAFEKVIENHRKVTFLLEEY